ncbi:MAG: hypothetical protein IT427_20750 [Pirellulales bacterium]|nr:hypothetical protein [Pirellulales bacterium]
MPTTPACQVPQIRSVTLKDRWIFAATASAILVIGSVAQAQVPFPTNNDPANQIRFDTVAEADAKRSQLVNFIWSGGLPSAMPSMMPNVALPSQAIGINPLNVASIDQLDADVSGWNFHERSYLIHPTNTTNANRVVIVHEGHANELIGGVGTTANHFLQNGFTVAIMEMPLFGWNTDKTASIPGRGNFTYNSHDTMITSTAVNNGGQGFRLFLEPVVQTINYITANVPNLEDIGMVGLSGGGWTTSMMSAIDPRIKLSVPVAGSAPLYHRNEDPSGGTVGDTEQYYLPLFREDIASNGTGGGVATWLEIYALGGYGQDRHQIQVTNEFDNCCFYGTFPNSYKEIVSSNVNGLGTGQWEHFLDSSHHSHQISSHVIDTVIDPLFGITNPMQNPSGLPFLDDFNNQTNVFPGGWNADPQNGFGFSAVEASGRVTVSGPSLASMVRTLPFNPQIGQPITITMDLASMTTDNFGGIFITDEVGSRPHHLGVLLNVSAKQIVLNADNGGGFDGSGDRVILGTLPGYTGGATTFSLTFDASGFSVTVDAGAAGPSSLDNDRGRKFPMASIQPILVIQPTCLFKALISTVARWEAW